MPYQDQIPWLKLCSHLQGAPSLKVLGQHQCHNSFKTLQCEHTQIHIMFHGNSAKRQ